jgi:hypothetical protein
MLDRLCDNNFCQVSKYHHKVIVRMVGVPADGEIEGYLDAMARIYDYEECFVILFDVNKIGDMSPMVMLGYIQKQVEFMRKYDDKTRKYMKRAAIVVSSAFVRRILNGVFTLKKSACKDLEFFTNEKDAKAYLRACLPMVQEVLQKRKAIE